MEREIVLSSCSVKNKGNNKPGKFITKFTRPIVLDNNHEYAIGLNRIINMSFIKIVSDCLVMRGRRPCASLL